jgi:hypothetical protein
MSFRTVFAIFCLAALAGCGSGFVPVEGTVRLDGQPLPGAQVMFVPRSGGRPATGKTDTAGQFQLTTDAPNDGALPGEYDVAVTAVAVSYAASAEGGEQTEKVRWIAPQRYSVPATSGLTAKISAAERTPQLELQSK